MTASELIEKLKDLPPEAPVVIYSMDTFTAANPIKTYFTEKMQMITIETKMHG